MKPIKLIIALVAILVLGTSGAKAQSVEKIYTGTLSNITMNGKSYSDVANVTFELSDLAGEYATLTGTIGPIGSMPGQINVDMTVKVSSTGILTADGGDVAGKLVLNTGTEMNIYISSFNGNVTGGQLNFVLNTYASKVFGAEIFGASVTFSGN